MRPLSTAPPEPQRFLSSVASAASCSGGQAQAGDHGHAFAFAALGLAADADHAVTGDLAGRAFLANAVANRALAIGAALADAGGIHDAAAVDGAFA